MQPAVACSQAAHLPVEHGQARGCVRNEELKQFFALAQRYLDLFSLINVPNGAAHFHRLTLNIEIKPPEAVYPPHRPVRLANDAIFPVKGLSLANHFIHKIGNHARAVVRMDQCAPSLNGALVLFADPK